MSDDTHSRWVATERHGFGVLQWEKRHIVRDDGTGRGAMKFTPDDGSAVLTMEVYYMAREGRSWVVEKSDGGTSLGAFYWRNPTKQELKRRERLLDKEIA